MLKFGSGYRTSAYIRNTTHTNPRANLARGHKLYRRLRRGCSPPKEKRELAPDLMEIQGIALKVIKDIR